MDGSPLGVFYIYKAFGKKIFGRSSMDKSPFEVLLCVEDLWKVFLEALRKVFYGDKFFGRSSINRSHFGGLLGIELLWKVLCAYKSFGISSINRTPLKGFMSIEDVWEVV